MRLCLEVSMLMQPINQWTTAPHGTKSVNQ